MGWHQVTDYQCSICHDPSQESCGTCSKNMCSMHIFDEVTKQDFQDEDGSILRTVQNLIKEMGTDFEEMFQRFDFNQKKYVDVDTINICEECFDKIHRVCSSCNTSNADVTQCSSCDSQVCTKCRGSKECWRCIRKKMVFTTYLCEKLSFENFNEVLLDFEEWVDFDKTRNSSP